MPQFGDYGLKVAEAFQAYLKTGDETLIDGYSARQLKSAISRLSPFYDANKQWYRSVEKRIMDLESIEANKKSKFAILEGELFEKVITFSLGLLTGILIRI